MILARYILGTLLTHMLTVLAALLGLITVFNFLEQLDDVGVGAYTMPYAMLHAVSLVPAWIMDFASIAAFLGALSGLGRLQQDSELTAMRAAGWSVFRIGLIAGAAGLLLSLAGLLVGEYVAPGLAQSAVERKAELRFGPRVSTTAGGLWTRDGDRIIGIDRTPGAPAVTLLTLDRNGEVLAFGEALDVRHPRDGRILYVNYRETRLRGDAAEADHQPTLAEGSEAVASLLKLSRGAPRFASMRQLLAQRGQLDRASLDAREVTYEWHERLARAASVPLLVLIAVPIALGLLRSSRQGARLLVGLAIGFALSVAQDAAHSVVSVYDVSPVLMAWAPALVTLVTVPILALQFAGWRLIHRGTAVQTA